MTTLARPAAATTRRTKDPETVCAGGGAGFEGALEGDAARVEVGLEEELGQAGFAVAAYVLSDLVQRAPQGAAILALRGVVDPVRAPAHDVEPGRVLSEGGRRVLHSRRSKLPCL